MKRLAGLSVLAVLIVGLSLTAQEPAAPATHPYYPIKTGSEWTYKVQGGPIKMKVSGPGTGRPERSRATARCRRPACPLSNAA